MNTSPKVAGPITNQTDSTKLVSLLALATGAVAMPQSGQADIIYTDLSANPAVVGYASDLEYRFTLPGTAQVGFQRQEFSTYTQPYSVVTINYRLVLAGDLGGNDGGIRGNGNGIAEPLPYGAAWNQGTAGLFYNIPAGIVNDLGARNPLSGFSHQYYAWVFNDSTLGGSPRYGWAEVSLTMSSFVAGGPNLTIWGYAYDNTGALPSMGQGVPEPSSGALLVIGALALGSRGVRNWRRNRETISGS